MDWQHILKLAKQGHPQAIAALINQASPWKQTRAWGVRTDNVLKIYLQSRQSLPQTEVLSFIKRGIDNLELKAILQIQVFNLEYQNNTLLWESSLDGLPVLVAADHHQFQTVKQLQTQSNNYDNKNENDLLKYLQDNASTLIIATSMIAFSVGFMFAWQLLTDPNISLSIPESLAIGNSNLTQDKETISPPKSDNFRQAVNQAMQAAMLTQTARSKQEWQAITQGWMQAIHLLELIPANDINYQMASTKILEYQKNLDYAQERVRYIFAPLVLKHTISGKISPKSIVHSGHGLFFAQNMMYSHTITVYDRSFKLIKIIPDTIKMTDFGIAEYTGNYQGSPVEATFSHQGQYAWISNYQMYGQGFRNPGNDVCSPSQQHDQSFVYRISTNDLEIDQVIPVGAVPKYLAATPDDRLIVVSNWCSWDISIIDATLNQEIKRIKLGRYPRGIAIDSQSQLAYVAVMGSQDIAVVNLRNWHVNWIRNVGAAPRHLVIDPSDRFLYVTLNSEGKVAKVDLSNYRVIAKTSTGRAPRSMAISKDGTFLYVVNYHSNSLSQIFTRTMQVRQTVKTNPSPIGVTVDADTQQVWVACYSGSLHIFQE